MFIYYVYIIIHVYNIYLLCIYLYMYTSVAWALHYTLHVLKSSLTDSNPSSANTLRSDYLAGGWTNPSKKILVKLDHFPR